MRQTRRRAYSAAAVQNVGLLLGRTSVAKWSIEAYSPDPHQHRDLCRLAPAHREGALFETEALQAKVEVELSLTEQVPSEHVRAA